jgi:hypothetical protein
MKVTIDLAKDEVEYLSMLLDSERDDMEQLVEDAEELDEDGKKYLMGGEDYAHQISACRKMVKALNKYIRK